jgi:methylglutaconyl-CoA hydratase
MYSTLELQTDGPITTLWMNRPDVHNAFNATLIAELTAACRALDADPTVRVVILAGRGRSFSAGADLQWMKRAAEQDVAANYADAQALATMLRTLAELKKPTIARIHGAALGGGTGLAAACDIAIASTEAVFGTTEVRLGLIPAAISPYVLRAIDARQAGRYFLTGEKIPAAKAQELGLIHEAVAPELLDPTVQKISNALLQGSPAAERAAKELIRAVNYERVNDNLVSDTASRIAHLRATAEGKEGVAAFLEKRQANWLGK